jgi:hypothetical protein
MTIAHLVSPIFESMQNCGDSEAVTQATAPLRDGGLSGVPTVLHALVADLLCIQARPDISNGENFVTFQTGTDTIRAQKAND